MSAERARRSRGRRQRADPAERAGRHAADDARGGDRSRRHGAVRREVRRRGARAVDGRRRRGKPTRPIRSSCAAAPMSARTGDIGLFKIVGEGAVAAGVRRIEALTGDGARRAHVATRPTCLAEAAATLKVAGRRGRRRGWQPWSRAHASSSASWPRRARRWRWAAAAGAPAAGERATIGGVKLHRPRVLNGVACQGPQGPGRRVQEAGWARAWWR